MISGLTKALTGVVGVVMLFAFILGLAYSISSGFAGFWGGLPFWVISVFVLLLALYNFVEECVRRRDN